MAQPTDDLVRREEREWQNDTGWTYQELAHARAGTRFVIERQFERIAGALELGPGLRLLDVGCGTGHLLDWLVRRAPAPAHGIDLSVTSVRRARAANAALRLAAANAEQLPFRDGSFDRLVYNGAAHHLLDLPSALREAFRLLAPGGRVVLFEPVATPFAEAVRQGLFRNSRYESPADLAHKHEFTRRGVESSLAAAGFTRVRGSFHDFFAYPLSGMYLELPWSRSRAIMGGLSAIEGALAGIGPLRPFFDLFSWRALVVAEKPGT